MSNKKESAKVEKTEAAEASPVKGLGLNALLTSERLGDKLAGVLTMFGNAEGLKNDSTAGQVSNKIAKAKTALRAKTTVELEETESIKGIRKSISSFYPALKDSMKNKEVEFTEEMNDAYILLLSFGKTNKVDSLPEELF